VDLVFACGVCGGDPATDTLLVQSVLAAVISTPFVLRTQLAAVIRRVRGLPVDDTAADNDTTCSVRPEDDSTP
jgi:hypothetical protein